MQKTKNFTKSRHNIYFFQFIKAMDNINELKIKGHPRKQLPAEMLLGLLFFMEFFLNEF